MKIALISDIHGNYPALSAILKRIGDYKCDLIISLGDIAGYYCMINECIDLCRKYRVLNVLGNHDYYLISGTECPRSTTANKCIAFQRKIITEENLAWLSKSIPLFRDKQCWFVHGGWHNPLDEYVETFKFSDFLNCGSRIFASGHTHVQKIQIKGRQVYLNPGSTGQPRDGDSRAAFALIDSKYKVSLMREEYDIDSIALEMKKNGFDSRLYSGLFNGTKIQQFNNQ